MAQRCAYCEQEGKITREHVIPHGIAKRNPAQDHGFVETENKYLPNEQVILDVCQACNNGPLRELDTYACALHDAYFQEMVRRGKPVEFMYDFDKLARWLLKVSFNSARAVGRANDITTMSRFRSYMLTGEPDVDLLEIALLLVSPQDITPEQRIFLDPVELAAHARSPDGKLEFRPESIRICAFDTRATPRLNKVMVRVVALNSYYFFLLLPRARRIDRKDWRRAKEATLDLLIGGQMLPRSPGQIAARASPIEIFDVFNRHLTHNETAVRSFHSKWLESLRRAKTRGRQK